VKHAAEGKVTVKELDELAAYIFAKRQRIEAIEELVSQENKELAVAKAKFVSYLKELGREDYKSSGGTLSIQAKWRVALPATDEAKTKFFDWLRERGIFDKYATVHSASLNSLYNAEWEAAKDRGEGLSFSIPGVPEPKLFEDLRPYPSRKVNP
jgi:hypothetical protein